MKINEITIGQARTLAKTNWTVPKEVIQYLDTNGFEKIGSGGFSHVYASPDSDVVVKVALVSDRAFLKFVDFVKQNRSRYLPRISSLKEIEPGKFLCFIERLEPIRNYPEVTHLAAYMYQNTASPGWFRFLTDVDKTTLTRSIKKLAVEFEELNPGFVAMVRKINKSFASNSFIDLTPNNVMYRRKTDDPVLTDPVALYHSGY